MTAARARAPKVNELRWADTLPSNDDSKLEALLAQAVADFRRIGLLRDGTRTAHEIAWGDEFRRVVAAMDAEVAA